MWQEARKQEKKIRGIMIDYKKRAERRQAYYTKMRMDPHQLIRVYGQKCKFHIMSSEANVVNTDGQLMPWQGDPEILIDRFDVRAHLDIIPEPKSNTSTDEEKDEEEEKMERKCNYERYRTLVQVDATGADEEQYLKQLEVEEEFGKKQAELQASKEKNQSSKAKIHYKYEGSAVVSDIDASDDDGSSSESELSDIDINIDVLELTSDQKAHLDALAMQYGMGYGQYCRQLMLEKKEFEYVKRLEEEEEERAKMPGRKGKSARRSLRAKQKTMRGSPFSFAVKEESPTDEKIEESESESSTSSMEEGNNVIEFITEFGGDTTKENKDSARSHKSDRNKEHSTRKRSKRSRFHSRTRHRSSRSRHRSRSRDRSRHSDRRHSRSQNKSSSRSPHYDRRHRRRSRSRSRSYSPKRRRSRSGRSHSRSPPSPKHKNDTKSRSESSDTKSRSVSNDNRSKSPPKQSVTNKLTSSSKGTPTIDKSKLTPREKMKLRMQKMLNKQIKTDKKVEHQKQVAKEQEMEERDLEIYEMSRMLRNREREKKLRRSVSPKGRLPSYDASSFRYRSRSNSPDE